MIKYLPLLLIIIFLFGCATADYDTFRYRESEFQEKLLARKIDQLFPQ